MILNTAIIRAAGKSIPDDVLAKHLAENKTGIGFAVASTKGDNVVFRKHVGHLSLEEAKKFLGHESLKNRQIIVSFSNDPNTVRDADVQPFPVLMNADNTKPILMAFLNGDFSQFTKEGQVEAAELRCLKQEIIPLITKVYDKFAGKDLAKTMIELKDELWAKQFANLMVGSNGCITLLPASGEVHTFQVETDDISGAGDGIWMANAYASKPADAGDVDDLAQELGDAPAAAPAAKPNVAPVPTTAPQGKKGGKGPAAIPDTKPIASTTPLEPAKPSAIPPVPGDTPTPKTGDLPDLGDPNAKLTINIPQNMETKKAVKWIGKRMPGNFQMPSVVSGLKTLTCTRAQATGAFLQTYLEQNKLGMDGVKALKSTSALPPIPDVAPAPGQKEFPASDAPKPMEPQKDTSTHALGNANPAEPTPVFTPRQIDETLAFVNADETKAAVDKHGNLINDPREMEKMVKSVDHFTKQFNDKVSLSQVARWPLETWLKYCKHDPSAAAKAAFWLSLEVIQVHGMLDAMTEPHQHKNEPAPAQVPHQVAAAAGGRRSRLPAIPA